MKRKGLAFILTGAVALSLMGCAANPEQSPVKEKNMDKMLEAAGNTEEGAASYADVKAEVEKNYQTYQTSISDENLKVKVEVDAKVEVPEAEQLSVYRVSQKKISQEFLDKVRKTLAPEVMWYAGEKVDARTKLKVAQEIQGYKDYMKDAEALGDKVLVEEYREMIAELEAEYEKAPDSVDFTDYSLDNQIQNIKQVYDNEPDNSFYEWLYSLHGDGEFFFGVSDAKDGNYQSLFMQNSEPYGNCLRYVSGKNGYDYGGKRVSTAVVGDDIEGIVPKTEGETPDFLGMLEDVENIPCVDNEPLSLSLEEAEGQADALMEQLGLTDYQCHEKGKYAQLVYDLGMEGSDGNDLKYRDIYRFLYLRKLDNVFVDNRAGIKLTDGWQGKDYVKKMWESEVVAIAVNDSGIAGFSYLSPLSVDENVVEKSKIKAFDEIRDTFEQMVVIENASKAEEGEAAGTVSIKVTDVRLVYTRISEKDSFDTGLVVPVWDFEGTIVDEWGMERTGNILSINAIDGSVINRDLGY